MLTLGSGVVKVAFWKSGAVIGETSNYFTGTVGYQNTGELVTVGEVGGDVEFDINFQEREFYGQSNFPIAKAFFGGKADIRARGVEINWDNVKNLFHVSLGESKTTATVNLGLDATAYGYAHDNFSGGAYSVNFDPDGGRPNTSISNVTALMGLPRPLYVKFEHIRSDDPSKSVIIHLPKAYSMQLMMPFTREDIARQDINFSAVVDRDCKVTSGSTSATPSVVLIEA
jgi:hypothetical protein